MTKFENLLEIEGLDEDAFLEQAIADSVVPGICMNHGCNYTREVEPDQSRGFCEECQTQTVKSGLVLRGII